MIMRDFFALASEDPTMACSHVSLYFALQNEWELQHFPEQMIIERERIMLAARIAGRATFQKCIHDLHDAGYVIYIPSPGCAKSRLSFRKLG